MTDQSPRSQPDDAARDIAEAFGAIVDRVSDLIEDAKAPGKPLDTVAKLTRKAPLTCLGVAFLLGIVTTRRR